MENMDLANLPGDLVEIAAFQRLLDRFQGNKEVLEFIADELDRNDDGEGNALINYVLPTDKIQELVATRSLEPAAKFLEGAATIRVHVRRKVDWTRMRRLPTGFVELHEVSPRAMHIVDLSRPESA